MIIKMFANAQYPQIESLSYKIQLITQSVLFVHLYSLQDTAKHCKANKDVGTRFLDGHETCTARQARTAKGGEKYPGTELGCQRRQRHGWSEKVSCGNCSVT